MDRLVVQPVMLVSIKRELLKGSYILCYIGNGNEVYGFLCYSYKLSFIKEINANIALNNENNIYIYNIFVSEMYRGNNIQQKLILALDSILPINITMVIAVLSHNYFSVKNIVQVGFLPVGYVDFLTILKFKLITTECIKSNEFKLENLRMA